MWVNKGVFRYLCLSFHVYLGVQFGGWWYLNLLCDEWCLLVNNMSGLDVMINSVTFWWRQHCDDVMINVTLWREAPVFLLVMINDDVFGGNVSPLKNINYWNVTIDKTYRYLRGERDKVEFVWQMLWSSSWKLAYLLYG